MLTSSRRTAVLAATALFLTTLAGVPAATGATSTTAPVPAAAPTTALVDPDGNPVVVDDGLEAGTDHDALTSSTFARASALAAAKAPKAKKKLKTLVIPVYWSGAGKDTSNKKIKKRIKATMTTTDTYYRTVSRGRIGHATTVLGWQKISRPPVSCGIMGQSYHLSSQASAKARKAGKNPDRYDRVIIYVTSKACDGYSGVAGLGSKPGKWVWLEGTLSPNVVIHELGHNLGLGHAGYHACADKKDKRIILGSSKQCGNIEYGDMSDMMGNNTDAGWFSAPKMARLGWFSGKNFAKNTSTKKKTYTLRPMSASSTKLKAVRVKGSAGRYYWVEYRTHTGLDKHLSPGLEGVQIRLGSPSDWVAPSTVVDMLPAPDNDWFDLHTVALLPRASWTSPEGIRFSVGAQGKTAKVTVQRGAAKAKKPTAPKPTLTALDRAVKIGWKYPKDRGTPIQSYDVRIASTSGEQRVEKFRLTDGYRPPVMLEDLDPTHSYSISLRAANHRGKSGWSTVGTVKPLELLPTITIDSPASGTSVSLPFTVKVTPSLPKGSSSTWISSVEACLTTMVDGYEETWACGSTEWGQEIVSGVPLNLTLDDSWWGPLSAGTYTLTATVWDDYERVGTASIPVVAN